MMINSTNPTRNRMVQVSGQALVEFAFVIPVLLMLMVVIVDFGIIFYTQMTITNAAWEGARAGATIVDPTQGDQEIIGAIQSSAFGLDTNRLVINIDPSQDEPPRNQPFPAPRGEPLTVTVQYQVKLSLPSITLPVTAQAITRMEYQNP